MARSLPARPNLESLKKQAKRLLQEFRSGEAAARERVASHHPRPEAFEGLRDAQLTLAREYGFSSWGELSDQVELLRGQALPAADRAAEFADLACLNYLPSESPRRIARARRLLEADPRLVEASGFAAAAAGDVAALDRWLAAEPARVRGRGGPRGWSPLLYATYSRVPDAPPARSALAVVGLLLERGADPNDYFLLDDLRFTALAGAIGEGEQGLEAQPPHAHARELAVLLLDAGADPHQEQGLYNSHFTPGNEWFELLLERGLTNVAIARPSSRLLDYHLTQAVKRGFEARVELLLRHGADPNAIDAYHQRSAQRIALRDGQDAIRRRLLAAGARSETLEPEDRIYMAARSGDEARVREIAAAYPELLANPRLLCDAAAQGSLPVIRALLDGGADVNGRVLGGATPLHGVRHGIEVAALLLERGAEVAAREEVYDATPVGWADVSGQIELRDYLLDRTTDVFDLTSWARVEQLERVLRTNPALATARRARGLTPLHRLVVGGPRGAAVIDLLLGSGADLNARADDGSTPLDTRVRLELEDIADLLRERGAKPGRE